METTTDAKTRIEKEAREYAKGWGENCDLKSYIAGATAERNKAIEQCINSANNISDRLEIKELIDEAADMYAFRVPYDGTKNFYDDAALKGFMAGAEFVLKLLSKEVK